MKTVKLNVELLQQLINSLEFYEKHVPQTKRWLSDDNKVEVNLKTLRAIKGEMST